MGETSDRIERAWSSVPDDPKNYAFFYHLLDADEHGCRPKINENTMNNIFNQKSLSCLRHIAESADKVDSTAAYEFKKGLTLFANVVVIIPRLLW